MTFIPERDGTGRAKSSTVTELDSCIEEDLAFTCSTKLVTMPANTDEIPFLLCKFPTGQTIAGKIRSFCIGINSTSTRSIIRFYKNPTITDDGTAIARENSHFKGSQNTAKMTMFKIPDISANGTFINMLIYRANGSTSIFEKEYMLDSEQNLLVTVQNNENSKDVHIDVDWLEG